MSGFEIAGVVLGSLPLLVVALEHYSDGVSTIQSMRKYETIFEYLHASLATSLAIYRNSLEELLSPLALSDSQLFCLLEDIDQHAWDDPDLIKGIRSRLGNSYVPFKSSIKQLHKKVNLFGHKLQLDEKLKPSWVSDVGVVDTQARTNFFRNPLNRIRGGFKSDKYRQLLSSLQDDIDRIASLTSGAMALEPLRFDRRRKANTAYRKYCREYAEHLYASLNSRWSSPCACHCIHEANLRLSLHKDDTKRAVQFHLVLSSEMGLEASSAPWSWRAVDVEPSVVANTLLVPHTQAIPQIVVPSTFDVQASWTQCVVQATRIEDLCELLKNDHQTACCMGILDDMDVKHHVHAATLPKTSELLQQRTTLQEIIDHQSGTKFNIKQKCSIALVLANAVLQLYDTPWLTGDWSTKDISLFAQSQEPSVADQPYISKRFTSLNASTPHRSNHRIIKNATVFALGVALLEVSHGQPLRTFALSDDLDDQGNHTLWTDYLIADRLVEDIHKRELPNYANAARRCIHCNFEGTVYSLDDDDFRERFYQGVIVPLQKDYDYVVGDP
ncbi:hypothetical protein CC86DRAFT_458775 [Ophiobolus disseminans]|uniref:DUF7580 domain-containing protein n=1 Tax=Ophiobolus disseminans TaxID=1469910 RepID=A0A6A6ZMV9_9PLEO|nr:hypothetical protein CC86DRAFT_458775 [Ophiobolus disseminans]